MLNARVSPCTVTYTDARETLISSAILLRRRIRTELFTDVTPSSVMVVRTNDWLCGSDAGGCGGPVVVGIVVDVTVVVAGIVVAVVEGTDVARGRWPRGSDICGG